MKSKFISSMNDLIAEAYIEMTDEDANQLLEDEHLFVKSEIHGIHTLLQSKIDESRSRQLALVRERFKTQSNQDQEMLKGPTSRSIDSMLKDIVNAMQNRTESVPDGILLAFRNQMNENNDESIQEIWNDLVALGLIQSDESEDKN